MDIWESQVTSTHRNQKSVSLAEAWLEETSIRRWLFHFFLVAPVNVSQALVSLIIWHSISCIEVSNICWENGCQNLLLLFIYLLVSLKIACTDGAVIRPARNFRLKGNMFGLKLQVTYRIISAELLTVNITAQIESEC